ncbi:MAG: anti-sigma factor [Paraburkholderia sp.]|uniref:sigma-E factor negative regulatory protein n=1 Tax=Paraburkholderia sp. TaxID=1926495 RepID=UPI001222F141|nr:RseA family anti-sigma factor [Paraburkholderia sp.]TAM03999.1 MAG: anti-sigma factor [Paraburkholderia sp.]TAM27915.1 MAG: anti-sigma factor [Paraburkholderia sp.]
MGSVSMQSVPGSRGERLSAFVDGELTAGERPDGIFSDFDQEGRARWSAYHLIGDVLRSDDLALSAAASQSFMAGFAARFEAEPHVLAPAALPVTRPATGGATDGAKRGAARILALRHRIVPTLAVAAAAATLTWIVVPQMHGMGNVGGAQVASVSSSGDGVQRVAMNAVPVQTAAVQDGNIIRDARLDAYLEAHQQFAQQPVMSDSMPLIRAATLTTPRQ